MSLYKGINLHPCIISYIKIGSKCVKQLNVGVISMKFLEENTGLNIIDF
jgi:hypothetical protein